jgi:hypothetical protein
MYFYDISLMRMGNSSIKLFRLIKEICGDDTLKNLVIVTNMWSRVSSKDGKKREKELRTDPRFFQSALDKGAQLFRHENTRASGHKIIRQILTNHPLPLNLQRELVENKNQLFNTMAGKELVSQVKTVAKTFEEKVAKLRKSLKAVPANEISDIMELQNALAECEKKVTSVLKNLGKFQSDSIEDKLVSVAYVLLASCHLR